MIELLCRYDRDVANDDAAFFAALEVDGAGLVFPDVEREAGLAGNFLIDDDGPAVLDHLEFGSSQRENQEC